MRRSTLRPTLIAFLLWALLLVAGYWLKQAPGPGSPADSGDPRAELAHLEQELSLARSQIRAFESQLRLRRRIERELVGGFTLVPGHLNPFPDLAPQRHSALIDLGEDDGVRAGYGVISNVGLIGRVAEVGRKSSRVLLAEDPTFHVRFTAYRRGDADPVDGIARGSGMPGALHTAHLRDSFEWFSQGQTLVTAGQDGVFPPGVMIGTISEVISSRASAVITLPRETNASSTILVVIPPFSESNEGSPR